MLELSFLSRMQEIGVVNFAFEFWTSISVADAMYYLVLRVKACCSFSVKPYLRTIPVCGQKPPIPHYDKSEKIVMVGFLKITLLMELKYFDDSRNSSQGSRLSKMRLERLTLVLRLSISSI